jgi:hypothetical protein
MLLSKKPAILFSSYASLPSFHHSPALQCTASCRSQQRHYAQHVAEDKTHNNPEDELAWPLHTHPTPYQILAIGRGQAYTKHRFIALAKLYHPDRCHPSSPAFHIPPAVRLERYRLLIAAHTILSDDAKRRAYDLWGSGWQGSHHSTSPNATPEQRQWPPGHDPIKNATWEDWERWYDREYQREPRQDARAVQMSNFGFLSLVFALVTVGGVMQGTRANMFSASIVEHRDRVHKDAVEELGKSKRATLSGGDRDERIRTFVEHREANLGGGGGGGGDDYQRLLPPNETCGPESLGK